MRTAAIVALTFLILLLPAAVRADDPASWVRGYPESTGPGCVVYTAQWSDGVYTSTPWRCDSAVSDSGIKVGRSYPELGADGCVWYVTEWQDGSYTKVPFSCPAKVRAYRDGSVASAPAEYTDPFAYCQAVGTIDKPDARYVNPGVTDALARIIMKAMGVPTDASLDFFARSSVWRCMEGSVYACNFGANIPCTAKADTNRTPSTRMVEWCRAHPGADFIPAVATGRETVYEWSCKNGTPAIVKELIKPDAAGFLSSFWYKLAPD